MSPDMLLEAYRRMLLIRRFEEAVQQMFARGLVVGTAHFCIGQEASAVGAVSALAADDLVTSNHRGHGHFLAKGADPRRLMAELFGKATGYAGGRGGSQHVADFSIGFLGSHGITAGMIPIATGAALSQKLLRTGRVVLAFFGDGATGQGAFHEAVNMGAVWELPIIYLCENNLYAMSTPVDESFRVTSVAERAAAYGIPGVNCDGNDVEAVHRAVSDAAERARSGAGPTLVEAQTYRQCGHSKSDECLYRTEQEEQEWRERDPLVRAAGRLVERDIATTGQLERIDEQVWGDIDEAVHFAQQSPEPDPETVADGVFTDFDLL
ncbi:MAG: thiamine pyrophosphate-dependent dehydrogenase E1 component subunit alpha [Armatimonadota bacterium]|nr:thiamine pyrophosphate-dependent dehydrogenase E1 component subunit alpha [Armatimonadota bacterium]